MAELSVIIPTIQAESEIECLRHLEEQEFDDYEVIVRSDPGASKARNEAIKRATTEKLVFLDDDSMPRPGYLETVSAALDEHAVVAGRVFQPDDAPITYKELPWYDQGDEGKYTDLVVGCNMAMRKSVIEDVGGFNEAFFHGHEETELAERILEEYQIYYEPEMVVDHYFATSVRQYWSKAYRHGKADADWWEVDDVPLRTRVWRCLPRKVLRWQPTETVAALITRIGRTRRLIDHLRSRTTPTGNGNDINQPDNRTQQPETLNQARD